MGAMPLVVDQVTGTRAQALIASLRQQGFHVECGTGTQYVILKHRTFLCSLALVSFVNLSCIVLVIPPT